MRLFVPLRKDELEKLAALARAERRRPQDQAAVLIAQALRGTPQPAAPGTHPSPVVPDPPTLAESAGAGR